ncbi:MAG TPA: hypothetical protein VNI02_13820 [Blastocatellia bacterium]|jgi:hypothetical protein|nr:hypothetical protein [Blastocatellia bacterium]
MEPSFEDDDRIRLYLLGDFPEAEQTKLEERLMTDDEFFKQLLAVEDELIDDYVHGSLSQPERARFEANFLSTPERQKKLSFARALDLYVSRAAETIPGIAPKQEPVSWWSSLLSFFRSGSPFLGLAFTAAALLLAAGGAYLLYRVSQAGQAPQQIRVEEKGPETSESPSAPAPRDKVAEDRAPGPSPPDRQQPTPADRRPDSTPPVALRLAAIILPGNVRSGGQLSRVVPKPGEKAVRVELGLGEDNYPGYVAEIRNVDRDGSLPPQGPLKAMKGSSGKAVFLRIPLDRYPPGDYIVTLKGRAPDGKLETAGTYSFRVSQKD